LKANAAALRARAKVLDLGLGGLHNAWLTNELINRGHAVTRELLKVGSTSVPTAVARRKVFVRDEREATKELAKDLETRSVPRLAILVDNRDSKSIASLILRMPDVSAHPLRFDAMDQPEAIELLPKLDVQHWPLFPAPTASLPTVHPFIEALHEILRIAHEPHGGRSFEPLQALNGSEKFHAVVRRRALAAGTFGFDARDPQHEAPTSRTWISGARTIGEEFNVKACRHASEGTLHPRCVRRALQVIVHVSSRVSLLRSLSTHATSHLHALAFRSTNRDLMVFEGVSSRRATRITDVNLDSCAAFSRLLFPLRPTDARSGDAAMPRDSKKAIMVPPFRCSPGRTRRRRSYQAIKASHTTLCPNCGAAKRSHTACSSCGYVRPGLQIKTSKPTA
jgi:ribosomal protein L32